MSKAHLTLIGAGPGDPELITIKAIKALNHADAILYDALVNPVILEHCKPQANRIFVGKRCGKHSLKQPEINQLIVNLSLKCRQIVRLKGGDPMIFGRAMEEILFARKFGLTTSIIPGISSALAGPSAAHIPLTHRSVSESFWVLTATTANHQLSSDVKHAAQSNATLVILMGTRKLKELLQLLACHRSLETGVALIHKATLPDGETQYGTIQQFLHKSDGLDFKAPGIIVIGEVVKFGKANEAIFSAFSVFQ